MVIRRIQTPKPQPIVGGDKDIHGCIGSAGYSWCEVKQKCLRVWEEKCEAASTENMATTAPTQTPIIESSFEYPYPFTWEDNDGQGGKFTYSITGAALGNVVFPRGSMYFAGSKYGYLTTSTTATDGDIHYALVLYVKVHRSEIDTGTASACAPLRMQRLVNEEGDFVGPNTIQFTFQSGCALGRGITFANRPVIFTASSVDKEFTFTNGSTPPTFFSVSIEGGTIRILKEPTEGWA